MRRWILFSLLWLKVFHCEPLLTIVLKLFNGKPQATALDFFGRQETVCRSA